MLKTLLFILIFFNIPIIAIEEIPDIKENGEKSSYTQFDNGAKLEVNKEHKRVIKIGHIGAVGVMPNDARILNISKENLIEEGLVGDDIEFEIVSRQACSESFEGVAVAAELYHVHQVRAFIGPYCAAELEAVTKMATFWNIPIISYSSVPNAVSDRSVYKTLARVSSKNTNSIAEATVALLLHYKWLKVAIATNTGSTAFERVSIFEEIMHREGVTIVKKVMFDENTDANEMMNSGQLGDLAANARIIICLFSSTKELSKEFMQATYTMRMNNAEYAYIIPWLQSGTKDLTPWIGADGEMLQRVKDHYANAIIVDDVNGFDDSVVSSFVEKIEKHGMQKSDIDVTNINGYLHLFDSLKLYALAIRKVLNETDNEAYVTNGQFIWNRMRRMKFEGVVSRSSSEENKDAGAIGTVLMDDVADRAPIFSAFYISPNRDKVMKMVNMESELISNCDGLKNKSGCFQLKINDIKSGFWPSEDGSMPLDEPICGYRGQRCSYLLEISVGSLIILLILISVVFFFLFRYCENKQLEKMPWRIFHDDLQFIDEEQVKSMMSVGSVTTKLSNIQTGQKQHAIIGVNTHTTYHRYKQRRPIKFIKEDMQLLTQMKQAVHDNLNPFLGAAFNEKEEMLVLWKFCSRGTIQDIIYNANVVLDEKFHGAFVRDITLGLEYLHASPIGYHGSLTPWCCLIDRNWMVKLSDYGIANPLERWEKQGAIEIAAAKDSDDKSQASQATSIIYMAPELLKNRETNKRRGMDQSWVKQSMLRRQAGDIYSFGMVMYEILFRSLPFRDNTNISELVDYLADGSKTVSPEIQNQMGLHPDLNALLRDCWSENPEIRPSIRRVRLNTEMVLKTKGSLVDQMMKMMEQYANNLEKLVAERTGMLEEANIRADQLLTQLLPAYVANELKMGRSVAPKLYSSATILFSDIVGFTTICSGSTPLEVVNMLNGLYTGFDECITRNKSYKVETIGDAYMVVSGIPEENEYNHSRNIANTALDMRQYLTGYQIPHRPTHRVRCRWGFHTGSVAAGVVGLTCPRYCLFGDTVNVSSRMESTGTPGMIQMSEEAHMHIRAHHPVFTTTERGEVQVKGKGTCRTFWLEDRVGDASTTNYIQNVEGV
ncbi:Receptor-type guanylate cyclase gcy-18 [Caenorhabditis elegans]|uniref:Receptor-type guanylate cyclase gcy-18 n=1 Tax=Caenorhabditis elegans TaxID=6239 RepID=GCY18_CAEEL|nr:Receptor-type guanylate cyclase gcy-18 [Caenorhabditis elegans]G5EFQ0.1 RecName: Full=Receptor-type guanylate cyclase gcy-18; Flags: Precursor [Caenorhabditis elegans]BAE78829.1 recepotor type guanyly cyclase [Caenorhabditis elegans]CAB05325.2 Receptor-type guanylate cyclase gcy-18 [Caenorhabditis elegans]|eukprot:NP_502449.2 Receptor-type guanylate cyclase gcy-18 [Caenorhabditis elegans]